MTSQQTEFDFESKSIQRAFEAFDESRPEVYRYLLQLALDLYAKGFRHYGIGALWERMRWHFHVERDQAEEYKLNNNYRSRYVRKMIAEHPELEDFFETRALRAE